MDVHPQFFDRQQTLILQPFVGHPRLGGQCFGESIWSLTAQADGYGQPQVATEFGKFADLGAAPAPLLDVAHAYPPPQPVVYSREHSVIFRDPEVSHPAAQVFREPCKTVLHGDSPTSAGQLLDAPFELGERLV